MSKYILFKLAVVLSILAGIVVVDSGPLASPTFAQRPNRERDNDDDDDERRGDEGRSRWEGRRGWGGRRGGGRFGGGEAGDRRGRERGRDENDDDQDEDSDDGGGSRIEGWARNFVKENDKNGDMMLQEDERAELPPRMARADLDGDNVITVEEIVRSASNRESTDRGRVDRRPRRDENEGSGGAANKSDAAAKKRVYTSVTAGGTGKETQADKRKSYRFTPAQERLTGDLPSWFKSRDRNKDGQVAMSEYGRSWNSRLVRQFQDLDLNDDGVITAKEAAE